LLIALQFLCVEFGVRPFFIRGRMTELALPSQARLSRRGRARLKRDEPVALKVVAEREQEAVDPPFDAPDIDDVMGEREADSHDETPVLTLSDVAEEEEPLELINVVQDAEALRAFAPSAMREPEQEPAPAAEPVEERRGQYQPPENSALKYAPRKDDLNETPVPPITVYACWDRPEIAEQQLENFAADKHLARAEITIERGGLDGAIAQCERESPDLLIVDTTLDGPSMLAGLDRLARVIAPSTKLIIIGAINDVALLRELAARGVAEYIVPPARKSDLIRAACRLFADAATARVFAVVGARGGVGASTLAQNLAWSIAERQWARTALIDLDLPFGATAFALGDGALGETEALENTDLLRARVERAERLEIIAANEAFKRDVRCDEAKLDAMLHAARRLNSFVVLDVPHDWNAWVKRALASADETIIVASPDLTSLRNTEGMLRQLKAAKARATPLIALSMVGMRQRCEIPRKDFLNTLGADAVLEFPFEPDLFGMAALKGLMLAEVSAKAKATADIEALATALTGRAPMKRKSAPKPPMMVKVEAAPVAANENAPPAEAVQAEPEQAEATARSRAEKPKREKKRKVRRVKAIAREPDFITYPLTFLKPGEAAPAPQPMPMADLTPPDVALVAALRTKALAGDSAPTRRALRVAAMTALLMQASAWTWQAQRDTADASELAPMMVATAPPNVVAPPPHRVADPLAPLRQAAESGAALAQYQFAELLRSGEGVAPDPIEALRWTERAASGGHCRAMYDLGVAYAQGDGARRDDAAAFRWFRQAAEYDVADAQYNLGLLYQQGVGVSASMPEALFWFLRAARTGDGPAAERAAMLAGFMPPADVEQAQARVQAFQPQHSALAVQCTRQTSG
jgi:pilus assembly protein CpaE